MQQLQRRSISSELGCRLKSETDKTQPRYNIIFELLILLYCCVYNIIVLNYYHIAYRLDRRCRTTYYLRMYLYIILICTYVLYMVEVEVTLLTRPASSVKRCGNLYTQR